MLSLFQKDIVYFFRKKYCELEHHFTINKNDIKEYFNHHNVCLAFSLSQKENFGFDLLISDFKNNKSKTTQTEEIILKNCENIPEAILCKFYEDLFYQESLQKNNYKKILKFKKNWYENNQNRFSEVKWSEILENNEEKKYFFQIVEPKVKSFKISSNRNDEKLKNQFFKNLHTSLFSNILKVSFGKIFSFDSKKLNQLKSLNGVSSIDFSIKDQNLGDYGEFFDITLKLKKTPSLAIEPEITLIDNQFLSSVCFSENNLLGSGISLKQKIFLKKFNPYYVKFEIDNKNLEKFSRFQFFGKYLKTYSCIGFIFKYFPSKSSNFYVKLGSGFEFCFKKNLFLNSLAISQLKPSFTFSNAGSLKSHTFFSYLSLKKFSKSTDVKGSIIFNNKTGFNNKNLRLNGLIIFLENRYANCKPEKTVSGKNNTKQYACKVFQSKIPDHLEICSEKSIALNTLISKNLRFFLTVNYVCDPRNFSNEYKKIEMKCEVAKIISFSWHLNNFGLVKTIMG